LIPALLLDTHIVVHWLTAPKRLSAEQIRTIRDVVRKRQALGISAMTLLEIAVFFSRDSRRGPFDARTVLEKIDSSAIFQILPITVEVAVEVAALGPYLRDPADRAIVSTARVHGLRLVTSDTRIAESRLVPVVV